MRVLVISPPAPAVSLEEAKTHLRVRHNEEDALIASYIAAAQGHIDGPEGWLGRAIGLQELEVRGSLFRNDPIRLPYAPVRSVDSVEYEDTAGAWQTMDVATYELRGDEIGTAWGTTWPATRIYRGAAETVRVRYQAGYEQVPMPITAAILLMVGDLYANRESIVTGTIAAALPMPLTVERLLEPYRSFS